MYLENKKNYLLLFFVCYFCVSCARVIEDPAKRYNDEFLKNNYLKIRRKRDKHLKLAKQHDIYYRDDKTDLIDSKYYNATDGTKLKKEYRSRKYNEEEINTDKVKYLDSDLSLYYRDRRLKDTKIGDSCDYNCDNTILYVQDNYKDYSKEKITFDDIEPTREQLYGSLALRKDKEYHYIDNTVMQKNLDYIDVMDRVKSEVYLRQKALDAEHNRGKGTVDAIKNKFKDLFK
ncbi:MAG: hypothetical protein J6C50_01520 [Rickettsiales bacterium]|nr:hypothetical protein [Rickettsiales bacterium]